MLRNCIIVTIAFLLLIPSFSMANTTIPDAAIAIAKELDKQLVIKFLRVKKDAKINSATVATMNPVIDKDIISIAVTTPVNINNLNKTCPLARQVSEEISTWLVKEGYSFEEIRKGKQIIFTEQEGETLLTRDTKKLAKTSVTTSAIMVGTYILTQNQVRFNIKLLGTSNNEVLAMASATIAISRNLRPLLVESASSVVVRPSIGTRLQ